MFRYFVLGFVLLLAGNFGTSLPINQADLVELDSSDFGDLEPKLQRYDLIALEGYHATGPKQPHGESVQEDRGLNGSPVIPDEFEHELGERDEPGYEGEPGDMAGKNGETARRGIQGRDTNSVELDTRNRKFKAKISELETKIQALTNRVNGAKVSCLDKSTPWNDYDNAPIVFLDRHNVECPHSYFLARFRFQRDPAHPAKIHYDFRCCQFIL